MSNIKRLLKVANNRNKKDDYFNFHFRLLKTDVEKLREKFAEDGMSPAVFFEAIIRAYMNNSPWINSAIEDWKRDHGIIEKKHKGHSFKKKEIEALYAAINGDKIIKDD